MFGLSEETIEGYAPYIKEYCRREVAEKKWNKLFENIRTLEDIIKEGEQRKITLYEDSLPLFFMIRYSGIRCNIENIKPSSKISNRKILSESSWNKVQRREKIILTHILERRGFKDFGYEICGVGGRCDVIAKHPETKVIIIGECGPCRLTKIYDTLKHENHELWHLTKQLTLYIYRRGKRWDHFQEINANIQKEINKMIREKMENSPFFNLNLKLKDGRTLDK